MCRESMIDGKLLDSCPTDLLKRRRRTVCSDKLSLLVLAGPGVKLTEAESALGRLKAREKDWDIVAPMVARTMPAAACQHHTRVMQAMPFLGTKAREKGWEAVTPMAAPTLTAAAAAVEQSPRMCHCSSNMCETAAGIATSTVAWRVSTPRNAECLSTRQLSTAATGMPQHSPVVLPLTGMHEQAVSDTLRTRQMMRGCLIGVTWVNWVPAMAPEPRDLGPGPGSMSWEWVVSWEADHCEENRGAMPSVALPYVSIGYSANLHSANSLHIQDC